MAKRFTDSRKWSDPWFRNLSSPYRWLWLYILDSCSHIGIWKVDFALAQFSIGEKVNQEEATKEYGDRIVIVTQEKWFIPKFLKFQYGSLSMTGRLHQKMINDLAEELPKHIFDPLVIVPGNIVLNKKEKEIEDNSLIKSFIDYWNTKSLSKVITVSTSRRKKIKERMKSAHFKANWQKAMDMVDQSSFCKGNSKTGWKASLDWFIANDTNYVKALEGKYSDVADRFSSY